MLKFIKNHLIFTSISCLIIVLFSVALVQVNYMSQNNLKNVSGHSRMTLPSCSVKNLKLSDTNHYIGAKTGDIRLTRQYSFECANTKVVYTRLIYSTQKETLVEGAQVEVSYDYNYSNKMVSKNTPLPLKDTEVPSEVPAFMHYTKVEVKVL